MRIENTIPNHWQLKKLGEVCHTTSGGTPNRSNPKYYQGNIPWVKSGELDKGLILDTEEKISEEAIKNSSAKIFPKGTLLIALYGATIGKLAFLGIEAATNQAVCGIFKSEEVDSNYLFNFLSCKRPTLVKQGIGGAQPNISQGILKNLDVPLPPLPEQHAIVSKIEELFSELENGKQQLQTALQQLKMYRQSLLKAAFEGKLTNKNVKEGELPKGWKRTTLGKIISISSGNGLSRAKRNDSGEYLVYGGNGVTGNHSEYLFESEQLIIGRVGVHCGNAYITKPKSWVTDNAFIVSFDKVMVSMNFLLHLIRVLNLNKHSVSTAQPVISQGKLYPIEVSLPPIEEQQLIVQELESRLTVCDKIEETITQSLQQAETLRQSILKQAFEGKLVLSENFVHETQPA